MLFFWLQGSVCRIDKDREGQLSLPQRELGVSPKDHIKHPWGRKNKSTASHHPITVYQGSVPSRYRVSISRHPLWGSAFMRPCEKQAFFLWEITKLSLWQVQHIVFSKSKGGGELLTECLVDCLCPLPITWGIVVYSPGFEVSGGPGFESWP